MVYFWDGLWLCSSGWTELCDLPYPLSLRLKLKTCVVMDGLCTWGESCTYAGTQVCSCTCGDWRPPWSIIPSPHPMFWQGCPLHLELPNWLDRVDSKSSNFPVSSFQCAITEAYHHAQFFSVGARVPISGLYTQKGNNFLTKPSLQPSRLFSVL